MLASIKHHDSFIHSCSYSYKKWMHHDPYKSCAPVSY